MRRLRRIVVMRGLESLGRGMFVFGKIGLYIRCKILYSSYTDLTTFHVLVSSLMDTETSVLPTEIQTIFSTQGYDDVLLSSGVDTDIAPHAIGSVSPRHAYAWSIADAVDTTSGRRGMWRALEAAGHDGGANRARTARPYVLSSCECPARR
jgi:hypothetical protein